MNSWFRMYAEALNDPKVQSLSGDDFKAWVNLLCLACQGDGRLPPIQDIAFALRMDNIAAGSVVDRLAIGGLIDTRKGGTNGSYIAPHAWDKRQYKSDSSTNRVKRFRERSKTVSETPPDTDTDTEQKSVTNVTLARVDFPRPDWADGQVWKDFLANRKLKKLRNTPTAYKGFLADIAKLESQEWPPSRLLEYAVGRGWGAIYDPQRRNGAAPQGNGLGRTAQAALDAFGDRH